MILHDSNHVSLVKLSIRTLHVGTGRRLPNEKIALFFKLLKLELEIQAGQLIASHKMRVMFFMYYIISILVAINV